MYQRSNKSGSSSKRSSFLPPDIGKEFGCYVKKPKLDIRLTPLSQHSPNKSPVCANKDPVDELWGEDLPEEAVEKCILLATQACNEVNVGRAESISKIPCVSNLLNSSLTKSLSNGTSKPSTYCPQPRQGTSNTGLQTIKESDCSISVRAEKCDLFNTSNTLKRSVSMSRNERPDPVVLERDKKYEVEYKQLKEKYLQKEGEVAILRSQLKKLELQIKTQTLDHRKSLEVQAQKFTKQLTEQKRELDVTNTQLQFQIMEATSIRNHCRVLESGPKLKLIEPQSVKSETSKTRKEEDERRMLNTSIHGTSSNRRLNKFVDGGLNEIGRFKDVKQFISIRDGSVFGLLINEYLTTNSQPDISWILYLRKKQSLCRQIKEAIGLNNKLLSLQKINLTLESCYAAINKLITLDAVSSPSAHFHVESIVRECQRIVCRQMHILHLLSGVQSNVERGNLNGALCSGIGKVIAMPNCQLMMSEKWYEDEEGIESRRALGLLCALCSISSQASNLISGSEKIGKKITKTKLTELDVRSITSASTLSNQSLNGGSPEMISQMLKNNEEPYNEYIAKPFGFLQLLRDISFSICFQKRTKNFVGLLTGIVKLLGAIGRNTQLVDESLLLVCEILREIVFCRPQIEVVVGVFELLSVLATYPMVMKSLCVNSGNKTYVDNRHIGLVYFTRESCVAQVLFRLLPTSATTVKLRTELCYHMVQWLYSMICFAGRDQCWLIAIQENKKLTCNCRATIASGLVNTLYHSLCDLDDPGVDNEIKWKLLETFKKGIVLLRVWQEDKTSWNYFNDQNFAYQLWLSRQEIDIPKLNLTYLEKECVKELLDKPEKGNIANTGVGNEDNEFWNIISNDCKIPFASQR